MDKSISGNEIQSLIIVLRGERVLIDADLARLYGVKTKVLNQATKRSSERFPSDFMFQLTAEEKEQLVTDCDRFNRLKHSSVLPKAFTEYGALMAANALSSPKAIEVSLYVVRIFVELRRSVSTNRQIVEKLIELERRIGGHDISIKAILSAIHELTAPILPSKRRRIGF